MRQVYLAATGQNRGKTTFALGLLAALLDRGLATAFTKPVGQRYAMVGDVPADEDAILMRDVFGLPDDLATMSPVHIPRGFTRRFIDGAITDDLGGRIRSAYARIGVGREMVVVEGTGHAGVGSVIGLSNADVAAMLGTPAIIVSEAGVGRPIDEIVLNHALFARRGVRVLGAVVNKVDAEAHPSLPDTLRKGLARHGIALLGTLPYRPILSNPTLSMLIEQMPGEVLHEGGDLDRRIEHVGIGAMQPRHVIERIGPGSLLIVPGDREDVIHATIAAARRQREISRESRLIDRLRDRSRFGRPGSTPGLVELAGILFTGGYRPRPREVEAIRAAGMFAYLVEADTYAAASTVHDLLVKTHPSDRDKIAEIRALVAGSFDVDGLLERLDTARHRATEGTGAYRSVPRAGSQRPPSRGFLDRLRRLAG
ncbi:MAG: AAA family ATPase [Candidatus Limnocylindrales bacterium]